jgi:hypothetical protein
MNIFGWLDKPDEVEKVKSTLKYKSAQDIIVQDNLEARTSGSDPILPYLMFRKITGKDCPCGPQKIGDCVSWGWSNCVNYLQIIKIAASLNKLGLWKELVNGQFSQEIINDHPNYRLAQSVLFEWEEICTEWVYGSSRVEIGGQKGDTEDGSVGAWAAKSVAQYGCATRKKYGPYDPQRAKQWGSEGVPDDYEPEAKKHACNDVVPVTSYQQLVTLLRAYRPVPVCSNQGFSQQRDAKGACKPEGTWAHCMLFCGLDDRDWPLCSQSWGETQPGGPTYLDQPTNTFFVDPQTADHMLKANDSFAPAGFVGFEVEDFIDWKH